MNASTQVMHDAIASACAMDTVATAARIIRYIEATRDHLIETGTEEPLAKAAAFQSSRYYCIAGEHVWKLVQQHFGTTNRVPFK